MAANPAVPFWDEGNTFTGHALTAVTGKRFVAVTGAAVGDNPGVGHAAASATVKSVGVAAYDAPAGSKVSVYSSPGIVMPVVAVGAIAAGALVWSAADGRATATTVAGAQPAGLAMRDAADGTDAPIKLI